MLHIALYFQSFDPPKNVHPLQKSPHTTCPARRVLHSAVSNLTPLNSFGSVALPGTLVLADMSTDVSTIAYHVLSIILILEIQRALSALLEKFGRQPRL